MDKLHLDDMEVCFKKINYDIGVGAFVKQRIRKDVVLRNVTDRFISSFSEEAATRARSTVHVTDDTTGETTGYQELIGTLSLFNQVCRIST